MEDQKKPRQKQILQTRKPADKEFFNMISEFRQFSLLPEPHRHQDSKILVCIRKRPLFNKEILKGEIDIVTSANPKLIIHQPKLKIDGISKFLVNHQFKFDDTFSQNQDTHTVYTHSLRQLCPFIMNQGTVTCFAYGQTGAGKTYTMNGIQQMVISDLLKLANAQQQFKVSFYQIYRGKCLDLLNRKTELKVLQDNYQNIQLFGISYREGKNLSEIQNIILQGNSHRTTFATTSNESSSRSHSVCTIQILQGTLLVGKLILVDLAGSQRAKDCKSNEKQRRIQGAQINKSLLALKECIRAYSKGESHVPYRGSKLTMVLRDSFTSSRSRVIMLTCISPGHSSADHSLNSLRYAQRLVDTSRPAQPQLDSTDIPQ